MILPDGFCSSHRLPVVGGFQSSRSLSRGYKANDATPVFIPVPAKATSICVLDVTGLTEGRSHYAGPRSCPGNGLRDFLPLRTTVAFLASQESLFRPPSTSFQPLAGCRSIATGPTTVIEVAIGAARATEE